VLDGGEQYLADARGAATFVRAHLWRAADATLLRRFRDGDAAVDGYAEDYAYLIFGLLELFQADGDSSWLQWALTLQGRMDELFWDQLDSGWYSTTGQDPSVLLRLKEEYDGAEPSANSVAVMNLLSLWHLTGDDDMRDKIERTLRLWAGSPSMRGRAVPMMMAALSTFHAGTPQIVIVGEPDAADTRSLTAVLRRHYLPGAIVVPVIEKHRDGLSKLLSWTSALGMRDGQATAYVCRDFACQAPTSSPGELDGQLTRL